MAVYTHIMEAELADFLKNYDLGTLKSFEGITRGVSNTNYHVFTDTGRYILTLFEKRRVKYAELPFFFAYSEHLSRAGIETPRALPNREGSRINILKDRAACFLNFLEGTDIAPRDIQAEHCVEAGGLLARMHKAAENFKEARQNSIGVLHWRGLVEKILPRVEGFEKGLSDILTHELMFLEQNWPQGLPAGVVHGDMFPDNVFFRDGKAAAVIDFYFSCTEYYAYDLAIALNAWCFDMKFKFQQERYDAFLRSYEQVRGLSAGEQKNLKLLRRGAVFRILISRLEEYFDHDPEKTIMVPHDPREYLERLKFLQQDTAHV
jgi:homoserine kinase type II